MWKDNSIVWYLESLTVLSLPKKKRKENVQLYFFFGDLEEAEKTLFPTLLFNSRFTL